MLNLQIHAEEEEEGEEKELQQLQWRKHLRYTVQSTSQCCTPAAALWPPHLYNYQPCSLNPTVSFLTDDLFNTTTWLLQPVLYCPNWIGACIKQGYFYSHGNQVTWLTLTTPCPIWWRQWMFSKNPSTHLERTFETSMKLPSFSSFHHWCRWMFAMKNCSLSKLIKKDDRCACQDK